MMIIVLAIQIVNIVIQTKLMLVELDIQKLLKGKHILLLLLLGFQLTTMWECDWVSIMDNINDIDRAKLAEQAEDEHINIRDDFYGKD